MAPGGHFGPVLDLSWDPQGRYFVSVSSDQTVRLHAPWVRENVEKVCVQTHLHNVFLISGVVDQSAFNFRSHGMRLHGHKFMVMT